MALELPAGYASVSEADEYIAGTSTAWSALVPEAKATALANARTYIDTKYSCRIDEDDPGDLVKIANIKLALLSLSSPLFPVEMSVGVKRTYVKAGPVATSKEYDAYANKNPDPFPEVSAILAAAGCRYTANVGVVRLVRA